MNPSGGDDGADLPEDVTSDVRSDTTTDDAGAVAAPVDAEAMAALGLPAGVEQVRVTDRFDPDTVPAGLQRAHKVAAGVWGELCVFESGVTFVFEETGARRTVGAGERQVIPPGALHHVEPAEGASFEVRFHR